jgi:hypothetical protein
MSDRIEKTIALNAPIERVWRALTDHNLFGEWFLRTGGGGGRPLNLSRLRARQMGGQDQKMGLYGCSPSHGIPMLSVLMALTLARRLQRSNSSFSGLRPARG